MATSPFNNKPSKERTKFMTDKVFSCVSLMGASNRTPVPCATQCLAYAQFGGLALPNQQYPVSNWSYAKSLDKLSAMHHTPRTQTNKKQETRNKKQTNHIHSPVSLACPSTAQCRESRKHNTKPYMQSASFSYKKIDRQLCFQKGDIKPTYWYKKYHLRVDPCYKFNH